MPVEIGTYADKSKMNSSAKRYPHLVMAEAARCRSSIDIRTSVSLPFTARLHHFVRRCKRPRLYAPDTTQWKA